MRIPLKLRPRLTYANVASTLALVLAMSMGGAYAHGKIGSADIMKNAVKSRHIANGHVKTPDLGFQAVGTPKIKSRAVTRGKLAPNARTNITRYNFPGHDFSGGPAVLELPGNHTQGSVNHSEWQVQLVSPPARHTRSPGRDRTTTAPTGCS